MYFVALVCPPALDGKILRYKYWMKEQFGCVVALRSPAHITLVPPFWLNEAKEPELIKSLESFSTGVVKPEIHVNGFSHFGNRVLFAAVESNEDLQLLKQKTGDHFTTAFPAIKKDGRPFHPHITIANRDMRPSHFEQAWQYFRGKKLDEKFIASRISLLKLDRGRWLVIDAKE